MTADLAQRLQQLVTGWHGAERGQPLAELHNECLNAAGPGGRHLLPSALLRVRDLDHTNLQTAIGRLKGNARTTVVRFRVKMTGRFDSALVPTGNLGEAPDHWLLAIEADLPIRDQVALYAHALGHLLLNREAVKMGQLPDPDPRVGFAHSDMLAELRMLEAARQRVDRRVLETYSQLTELLRAPEEPPSILDAAISDLRQRLAQSGWRGPLVETPYIFTAGRVFLSGSSIRHGNRLRLDALLRDEASLPMAAVQTIRAGETREEAIRRLMEYAHNRLALPFAYLILQDGTIEEFDWSATTEPLQRNLNALPSRDELWERWTQALGLIDRLAHDALRFPYQLSNAKPRYYQEAAINRAIIAVLQAKRGLRPPRILLTLATGTGKTKVAFQLIWKLKRARAIRNVLFITDRDYLLGQAMDNEFAPFGDARQRIRGVASTSRDIFFATYQAIADTEVYSGLFRDYPPDFFDIIIIDECHRGSARDDSNWRAILDRFDQAVHIGLTATPLSSETVQTDRYFGDPIYTYSLRTGINDGFLAPYRVRRVLIGLSPEVQEAKSPAGVCGSASSGVPKFSPFSNKFVESEPARELALASGRADGGDQESAILNDPLFAETSATMLAHTQAIAQHLAAYLQKSDPLAKTIVFCVDQDHAEQMRIALEQACPQYVTRYPGYVERIVSDEGTDGKRALGRFSTPDEKTPVLVTTSRLLSTGVDVPTCKNIVLARPVGTIVEFKQIIGRGTRLYEPDKTWFSIIDYAGAIKLFFDPAFDGDPELVEVEPLIPQPQQTEEDIPAESAQVETPSLTTPTDIASSPLSGDNKEMPSGPASPAEQGTRSPTPEESAQSTQSSSLTPHVKESDIALATDQDQGQVAAAASSGQAIVGETGSEQPGTTQTALPASTSRSQGAAPEPPSTPPSEVPVLITQTRKGNTIKVIGEYLYELGSDGKTLISCTSYRDFTVITLQKLVSNPADLRASWLRKEQRDELRDRLAEEGIDLQALATSLHLPGVDQLDLLLHVTFNQPIITRSERVERLYREHPHFFSRYKPAAREILDIVLTKYIDGEAQDVSDTQLLKVPPISHRGTYIELMQFFEGGANLRTALKELQHLLYNP